MGKQIANDVLQIQMACTQQINKFAALNDAGEFHQLVEMFTPDGVFARPSQPDSPLVGRHCILQAFNDRPKRHSVHLVSNIFVDVVDASHARAFSRITLFASPAGTNVAQGPHLIGCFEDEFVLVDGHWLFASRLGKVEMKFD